MIVFSPPPLHKDVRSFIYKAANEFDGSPAQVDEILNLKI